MSLNLYRIYSLQPVGVSPMPAGFGYDTYSEAVVAARSPEEAQGVHPNLAGRCSWSEEEFLKFNAMRWRENKKKDWTNWPNDPKLIKVQYIGTAAPDLGFGVVVAIFNFG